MPFLDSTFHLRMDAAARLGVGPLLRLARHRIARATGRVRHRLGRADVARGPFLDAADPHRPATGPATGPTGLPPHDPGHRGAILAAARDLRPAVHHGPFDPHAPALTLDLFASGDVRPIWEANRLAWLPLLVQAHRLDPAGGHLARAEGRLAAWVAGNPPWRGPNWACGQEAAFRVLHLSLSVELLGGAVTPGMAGLLRLHARRIAATRDYARAQDNNHSVSEPAGLLAASLLLGDPTLARAASRDLTRAVTRLVAPDGGFAVVSTGYHRLLLDTLSVTEGLRRRRAVPRVPPPVPDRAAAATLWLHRLTCPETGATPRLGHQDGSRLADLSLRGPDDARGSVERAARLFLDTTAGHPDDPGGAWLGLSPTGAGGPGEGLCPPPDLHPRGPDGALDPRSVSTSSVGRPQLWVLPTEDIKEKQIAGVRGRRCVPGGWVWEGKAFPGPQAMPGGDGGRGPAPAAWIATGSRGWSHGRARVLLRTGPLRFRPGHADILHLDLWDGPVNPLRDAGTGAYNPPADRAWWAGHFPAARAHNLVTFDDAEPMPRAGRFLLARWPRTGALPDGAATTDHRGNRHERRVRREGGAWVVEDRIAGPFRAFALRWHLSPGDWVAGADGVSGASVRLTVTGDVPLALGLESAWESRAYGEASSIPSLVARGGCGPATLLTRVVTNDATGDCNDGVLRA